MADHIAKISVKGIPIGTIKDTQHTVKYMRFRINEYLFQHNKPQDVISLREYTKDFNEWLIRDKKEKALEQAKLLYPNGNKSVSEKEFYSSEGFDEGYAIGCLVGAFDYRLEQIVWEGWRGLFIFAMYYSLFVTGNIYKRFEEDVMIEFC